MFSKPVLVEQKFCIRIFAMFIQFRLYMLCSDLNVNSYAPLKVQARTFDCSNDPYCSHARLISRVPY